MNRFIALSVILLAFMFAWSTGLATPLVDFVDPSSEAGRYIVNKGVLAIVIAIGLFCVKGWAEVGYRKGAGVGAAFASYLIGVPLIALGLASLLDPGRATLLPLVLFTWVIAICLISFTEETLFRGVMWRALQDRGLWIRAIATSFVFGLIHFIPAGMGDYGWDIAFFYGLSASGFGLIFAAMRERAGSIYTVVVAHVLFDIAAISQAGNVSELLEPGVETYIRFFSAFAVFSLWGAVALFLIQRRDRKLEMGSVATA